MDFFSQIYFTTLFLVALWAAISLFRMLRSLGRSTSPRKLDSLIRMEKATHNLQAYKSVGTVLATGCFANQIFRVWEIYVLRVTDANPMFALKDAWNVSQALIALLLVLEIVRWYGFVTLETYSHHLKRTESAHPAG